MRRTIANIILLLHLPAYGADYVYTDLGVGDGIDVNGSGQVLYMSGSVLMLMGAGLTNPQPVNVAPVNFGTPVGTCLNDAAQVGGFYRISTRPGASNYKAFLVTGNTTESLAVLNTIIWGANEAGKVAGESNPSFSPVAAFLGDLPEPPPIAGTGFSTAHALNDAGVAAGSASPVPVPPPPPESPALAVPARACRFVGGTVEYLDTRNPGTVLVENVGYQDFNPPDPTGAARLSDCLSINSLGQVVGYFRNEPYGPQRAFREVGQGMQDLGTLGGTSSTAWDINGLGQIVGEAQTAAGETHAFLWHEGTMLDLNLVVPAVPGRILTRARSINQAGRVVGQAQVNGVMRGFVLDLPVGGIAPQIPVGPVGATLPLGGSLTLSATVVGTAPISLQWEKDHVALPGQTNNILVLNSVTGLDSGDYQLTAENEFGRAISLPAAVVVVDPRLTIYALAGLLIEGAVGATYQVQFAPMLATNDWQPLAAVTLTNSVEWYVDYSTATNRYRIYRAIRQP